MNYEVKVEVELLPGPDTFLALVNALELLRRYGWVVARMDSGPAGKITVKEKRVITYTVGDRPGAGREQAVRDVHDALHGVGNTVRFIRNIQSKIDEIPGDAGKAVGGFLGGAVDAAGEKTGLGSFGILGFGALASALILGVLGVALVVAVKRG